MHRHSRLLLAAFGLTACAPRALDFHETTKVAFAAADNTSDSPLAKSLRDAPRPARRPLSIHHSSSPPASAPP